MSAHEKAIYQQYRGGDKRKNVNRPGGVEDEKPQHVEEEQGYKDYPGYMCYVRLE